jgi:hypothetical protein
MGFLPSPGALVIIGSSWMTNINIEWEKKLHRFVSTRKDKS